VELRKLEALIQTGRITRSRLEDRVKKALAREHLSSFVVTTIDAPDKAPTLQWEVDAAKRRDLEKTRLGRRVLCTDRHNWSMGRIVYAFRGQWNVEELFRRAKKGGVVPLGAVASVGRWVDTAAYLRHGAGIDADEPGKDRAHAGHFGPPDAGRPGADQGHPGAHHDRRPGTKAHGVAGTRAHCRATPRGEGLRAGQVVSCHSFIYHYSPCQAMTDGARQPISPVNLRR
jgi:hypothetical protein